MPQISRRAMLGLLAIAGSGGLAVAGLEIARHETAARKAPEMFRPTILKPSQVLDLRPWKVGLPSTREVNNPQLQNFSDTDFDVVSYVQFTAYCGDKAQSGSKYARSELREMTADGKLAAWSTTSGTHRMSVDQRITHLPVVKPQLICGQIHNEDYLVLVELAGTKLYVRHVDTEIGVLDPHYVLSTPFTLEIVADGGRVDVTYNHKATVTIRDLDAEGCYFKAGCYVQSSVATGDAPTAFGQVQISQLAISHSD